MGGLVSKPTPYSQTKEYRKERGWKWRQDHGSQTIRGLVRVCRFCGVTFSPRHTRALTCSIPCGKAWNKANRVRPNPIERFERNLRWSHSLSLHEYKEILEVQNNLCKLCGESLNETVRELRPCIDHDHNCCRVGASCNKCRRGIIHQRCNLLLGHAGDRVELLQKAIDYLETHNALHL